MHYDEFIERFPEAEWLESKNGKERWSNMEGEGSLYETLWFCSFCGEEVEGPSALYDEDHECKE